MMGDEQAAKPDSVWFTARGRVVIPKRLRKLFCIKDSTRAVVTATPEGILLKPVTRWAIKRARDIVKRKPGDKPFKECWAEYKREEIALEDAKYACHGS